MDEVKLTGGSIQILKIALLIKKSIIIFVTKQVTKINHKENK